MNDDLTSTASDETVSDETVETASPTAVGGDFTRLASDAELSDLMRLREAKPRHRRIVFGIAVMTLVALIVGLVYVALSRRESTITWPGEISGDYNDARRIVRVAKDAALLLFWPQYEGTAVSGDGTNVIDVITAIGRSYDVPFHINFSQVALTNGWRVTTSESYQNWKRAQTLVGWTFDVASEKLIFLNENESGYPAWAIDYNRAPNGCRLAGRAFYLRHGPREIVVLRELPIEARGRADAVLNGYKCLAANASAAHTRFEIPSVRAQRDSAEILETAYTDVMSGFQSADWRRLDLELRSAIIAAEEADNDKERQRAKYLYSVFRTKLQNWYVRQCLEFQALVNGKASVQKAEDQAKRRTAIRRETAERLPNESDCRQLRIAEDDWRVL